MSKRTEATVFQRAIVLPGVRVTKTAMVFERMDDEAIMTAGAFLQAVDEHAAWWRGDHLAAFCGYRLAKDEEENGRAYDELTREDKRKRYTSEYSETWGKEAKTLWHYRTISRFYETSCRQEELSWTHHYEAWVGAGNDLAIAQDWLDKAKANGWSASQLRAAIRKAKRAEEADADGPEAQSLLPIELTNCRRWASAAIHRVADMDEAEARAHLAELEQVHAYILALTRRLSPPLSALTAPTGAKESLPAAS